MNFDFDSIQVLHPYSSQMLIKKTLWGKILILLGEALCLLFWYLFFWRNATLGDTEKLFLLVFPLLMLAGAYKPLKTIIKSDNFLFDQNKQGVYQNDKNKSNFQDISNIEIIRLQSGSDTGTQTRYSLLLRLNDKSSIQIYETSDRNRVYHVAGEIASFINKQIKTF